MCIPISQPSNSQQNNSQQNNSQQNNDELDIASVSKSLNLPLVEEPEANLWSLGPDSIGGKALSSATWPA